MKTNIIALLEFCATVDWDKSTIVLKDSAVVEENKCKCGGDCDGDCGDCDCDGDCKCNKEKITEATVDMPRNLIMESLSDEPEFPYDINEDDENVFFVKGFEATENACGTGTIHLEDRVSHMNMCQSEGVATVDLTVVVGRKRLSNIPFVLKITEDHPHILLNKVHLQ